MPVYSDQAKQYLQELLRVTKYNLTACGYEKLSITGTAAALTVPADANYAVITVESSIATIAVRYLELGASSLPTSTDGFAKSTLDVFDVHGQNNLINFRAIQVGAGTHTLHIMYYK